MALQTRDSINSETQIDDVVGREKDVKCAVTLN